MVLSTREFYETCLHEMTGVPRYGQCVPTHFQSHFLLRCDRRIKALCRASRAKYSHVYGPPLQSDLLRNPCQAFMLMILLSFIVTGDFEIHLVGASLNAMWLRATRLPRAYTSSSSNIAGRYACWNCPFRAVFRCV